MRENVIGVFGIPGENEKGRRAVDFCAEIGCASNMYFMHKNVHKYTRTAIGLWGMELGA